MAKPINPRDIVKSAKIPFESTTGWSIEEEFGVYYLKVHKKGTQLKMNDKKELVDTTTEGFSRYVITKEEYDRFMRLQCTVQKPKQRIEKDKSVPLWDLMTGGNALT